MRKDFIENFKIEKKYERIINVFLWFFVILALIMTLITFVKQSNPNGVFKLGNNYYFVAKDNTMSSRNGFDSGDIIIVKTLSEKEKNELSHNEVVVYTKSNSVVKKEKNFYFKRIFEILVDGDDNRVYIAKGDTEDAKNYVVVEKDLVFGKWTGAKIPFVGKIILFLETYPGFILFIAIPLLVFFFYELLTLLVTLKKGSGLRKESNFSKDFTKHRDYKTFDSSRYSSLGTSSLSSSLSSKYSKGSHLTRSKITSTKPTAKKTAKTKAKPSTSKRKTTKTKSRTKK